MSLLATALDDFRRDHDLSYLELANAIERDTHHRRDQDCWRKICQGETSRPQARTLDIIEVFLAKQAKRAAVAAKRRAKKAA